MKEKISVLFICMGNICRSPMAHGVFVQRLHAAGLDSVVEVDSAGTHGYHIGKAPDPRAQAAAGARGYDLSGLRARRLSPEDFDRFDYILVMDEENLDFARALQRPGSRARLYRFLEFAPERSEREVPDPHYGGAQGFTHVMDLVEAAADGLLAQLRANHGL